MRAGNIGGQWQLAVVVPQHAVAAQRSAANAGSVTLTADVGSLTDLFSLLCCFSCCY